MIKPNTQEAQIIELTENLDLTAATPLSEALHAVQGQAVQLNTAKVERLGAQCLQVLLSASQSWSDEGIGFEILDASPAFSKGLEVFGLGADTFSNTEST